MNDESIANLRLDRRLQGRRGWISEEDFQRELDALPDASDKIMPVDEEAEALKVAGRGQDAGAADAPPAIAEAPQAVPPFVPEGGGEGGGV